MCTYVYDCDDDVNEFVSNIMRYAKKKQETINKICRLGCIRDYKLVNGVTDVDHVKEFCRGWTTALIMNGLPATRLFVINVPYSNTPHMILFLKNPINLLEESFPEIVVRSVIEA